MLSLRESRLLRRAAAWSPLREYKRRLQLLAEKHGLKIRDDKRRPSGHAEAAVAAKSGRLAWALCVGALLCPPARGVIAA